MKKTFSFFITIIFFSFFLFTSVGQAQILSNPKLLQENSQVVRQQAGFSDISIGLIISYIISAALALLGVIFLVLMVVSGFKWMTAAGNEEQVKKSLETIKASLIGLVIVLAAYAITSFIFTRLPFSGGKISAPNAITTSGSQ